MNSTISDAKKLPVKMYSKKTFFEKVFKYKTLLLMLLPVCLFYLVFAYFPMVGVILAFKQYDYQAGIFGSEWIGLSNFKFFFVSGQAWTVTRNTVLYNMAFITVNTVLQVSVAIILSEIKSKWYRKAAQTSIFFPYFISWVVVSGLVYNLFSYDYGVLNNLLKLFGQGPVNVYATPHVWPIIIVIFNAWKGVGYGSVVYLASITGMDTSIYEAAEIDGANIFQRIWYITLRGLVPTIITMVLLALGQVFRGNLDMFYQMVGSNGLLYNYTDVIDTFTFRTLFFSKEVGMSAAVGFYQSLMCFGFIMLMNMVVKKIDSDSALF